MLDTEEIIVDQVTVEMQLEMDMLKSNLEPGPQIKIFLNGQYCQDHRMNKKIHNVND